DSSALRPSAAAASTSKATAYIRCRKGGGRLRQDRGGAFHEAVDVQAVGAGGGGGAEVALGDGPGLLGQRAEQGAGQLGLAVDVVVHQEAQDVADGERAGEGGRAQVVAAVAGDVAGGGGVADQLLGLGPGQLAAIEGGGDVFPDPVQVVHLGDGGGDALVG